MKVVVSKVFVKKRIDNGRTPVCAVVGEILNVTDETGAELISKGFAKKFVVKAKEKEQFELPEAKAPAKSDKGKGNGNGKGKTPVVEVADEDIDGPDGENEEVGPEEIEMPEEPKGNK